MRDCFNRDYDVFFLTLKDGGLPVSLKRANVVEEIKWTFICTSLFFQPASPPCA